MNLNVYNCGYHNYQRAKYYVKLQKKGIFPPKYAYFQTSITLFWAFFWALYANTNIETQERKSINLKIKWHGTICHCGVHEKVLSHCNEYLQHLYCHSFFTFCTLTNRLDLLSGSVKIGVKVSFRNQFLKVGIQRRWEKSSLHVCTHRV